MANRQSNNLTSSISVLAITIGLVAGQSATQKSVAQTSINGAGASTVNTLFVGPKITTPSTTNSWFNTFGVANPSTLNPPGPVNPAFTFRYASVGSGAGLRSLTSQTPPAGTPTIPSPVSFAAVDDPLIGTETVSTNGPNRGPIIQVPVIGVGLALAYNPTGLNVTGGIRLSRATYCAIFNGNITNWNDSRITADNGRLIASNRPLRVARRSDSSGSTFVLSSHLNTVCKTTATPAVPAASVWNRGVGNISTPSTTAVPALTRACNPRGAGPFAPAIPTDTVCWWTDAAGSPSAIITASGGGALGRAIAANAGAIGYLDNATRLSIPLPAAILRNRAGNFITLSSTSITEALVGGTVVRYGTNPTNRLIRVNGLVDPTRAGAYPISTASYALFYDVYGNTTIASGIRAFINWALANAGTNSADQIAVARGYAPLPNTIKTVSRTVVNTCVNTVAGPSPCTP